MIIRLKISKPTHFRFCNFVLDEPATNSGGEIIDIVFDHQTSHEYITEILRRVLIDNDWNENQVMGLGGDGLLVCYLRGDILVISEANIPRYLRALVYLKNLFKI